MRQVPSLKSTAGLIVLAALCVGFSCTTTEQNSDYGSDSAPQDRPANYGNIPSSAERVAEGFGRLEYRAARDGTAWITNDSRGYVVVSRRVSRGDKIEVIPDRNRVEVEGRIEFDRDMESSARHAIFLSGTWDNWSDREPYAEIPRRARSMASGTGRIEWRVEESGRVWVGNDKRKSVVYSGDVRRGDVVEVIPGSNQVKVNGRTVFDQNMESRHEHTIFFADVGSMGGR